MDKPIVVTIYTFAGKRFIFNIPWRHCKDCDLTVSLVTSLVKELGSDRIKIVVAPWHERIIGAFSKKNWHTPAVLIDGETFSEGALPNMEKLREELLRRLKR